MVDKQDMFILHLSTYKMFHLQGIPSIKLNMNHVCTSHIIALENYLRYNGHNGGYPVKNTSDVIIYKQNRILIGTFRFVISQVSHSSGEYHITGYKFDCKFFVQRLKQNYLIQF